jgi:hypothetical protein
MSRLTKLISKTLKELKVRKKVDESYWEREPDEDGWDVINYYSTSNDSEDERERIGKLQDLIKNKIDKK